MAHSLPYVDGDSAPQVSIERRSLQSRSGELTGRCCAYGSFLGDGLPDCLNFLVAKVAEFALGVAGCVASRRFRSTGADFRFLPEPGVYGIWSVLLLPAGIIDQLTPGQMNAIVAHELCHVRRRDNLGTVIHMAVEAVFWFHPLVWWIGARLMEERERACDEEVLRWGYSPQVRMRRESRICELYMASPLDCVAEWTGANLKVRIEEIMANRESFRLKTFAKKVALGIAGVRLLRCRFWLA